MITFSEYMQRFFPGLKVQKISVNAGFSCPNRDGTKGFGGCIYCRNDSFSPSYCMETPGVTAQIEKGKAFFRRKYPEMKYLAYFQSFTNTHSHTPDKLRAYYEEALQCSNVAGIIVGTRPDTLPDATIGMLADINRKAPLWLEIGAESSHNATLERINRRHTWEDVEDATRRAAAAGLHCGLHLIEGLPGESRDDMLCTIDRACALPIESLKLHQLQILRDTPLAALYEAGKADVVPFTLPDYLDLCAEIVGRVPPHIMIERFLSQSPPDMVIAPKWGLKNYQFADLLRKKCRQSSTISE